MRNSICIKSPTAIENFDYFFAENGLTAYKLGQALPSQSFIKFLGEARYKSLANFILHYIADLDIPIKRCVFTGDKQVLYEAQYSKSQRHIHRVPQWNG